MVSRHGVCTCLHLLLNHQEDEACDKSGLKDKLKTLYLVNRSTGLMTELASPMLNPPYGCAFSHDGRRVACVTHENVVRVWSPWACEGMIPDLSYLKMNRRLEKSTLQSLLDEYGPALINMPDAGEMPDADEKPDANEKLEARRMPFLMQLAWKLHAEEFDQIIDWLVEGGKVDGGASDACSSDTSSIVRDYDGIKVRSIVLIYFVVNICWFLV